MRKHAVHQTKRVHRGRRQRGVALIMAMAFLVVLTLLGVAMLSSSSLELKMSSNALAKTVSFNAAEDVRLIAEDKVTDIVNRIEQNNRTFIQAAQDEGMTKGYYDLSAGGTGPGVDLFQFWDNSANYMQVGASGNGYAVEYLGVHALFLNRTTAPAGGNEARMHVFRLTISGVGSDGARTTLQSMLMKN